MPQDHISSTSTSDITTTGRTAEDSTPANSNSQGPVQPGSDPLRPVNPDPHGPPAATQDTTAAKLEEEAANGPENRY